MPDLDPDPVERLLADDAARDHARAHARGQRVREITQAVVSALDGAGVLNEPEISRRIIYGALVDALYGNAAVDIDARPITARDRCR